MLRSMTIRFSTLLLLGILLVPATTAAGAAANGVAASGPAVDFSRQTEAKGGTKKPYVHTGAPKKSKSSGGGNAGGGQPLPPSCPVGTCNTLQDKVNKLDNEVDGLKDEVEMTCPKAQCEEIKVEVGELQNGVGNLETDVEELKDEVDKTCPKTKCDELQARLDTIERSLPSLCTDLPPKPLPSNANVDVTYQLNLAGTACIPCYTGTAEDVTTACGDDCCAGGSDACANWLNAEGTEVDPETTATICSGSCNDGIQVCEFLGPGAIVGPESCNGATGVCRQLRANVVVGASSCNNNDGACFAVWGSVGNNACNNGGDDACRAAVCVGDNVQACDPRQICLTTDYGGPFCDGADSDPIPGLDLGPEPPNTCICTELAPP